MKEARGRPVLSHLAILLVYIVVAAGATWPLAARLTTHLPDGTDTLLHYWNGWWTWQAVRSGQSPYYTSLLFYPNGLSMVYNNFPWLHILTWMGLRLLFGGIAAYNLTFLLHLALCGFAAYLLAHDLTQDTRAAFVAGSIYLCWPYRISQPSHPNLISTTWIPMFLLFLHRTMRRGRWQDGLLAGLSLAVVGYTRWQLLIPAGIIGSLYALFHLRTLLQRRQILVLLLAGAVATAALAPPAMLLVSEWRANPAELTMEGEETMMRTDVLAYLTPARSHPVLGTYTRPAYARYYPGRGSRVKFSPYLGILAMLLGLLGVWKGGRDRFAWLGIALVLLLLALGPILSINGHSYPRVPMPYDLASRLYVVRLLRAPERFNMFLALPVATLAAYGSAYLLSCLRRWKGWSTAVFLLLWGGICFEYLAVPMLLQPAQVAEFYAELAAEPGDYAILNVPVDPYDSKPFMFAQTVHTRPILQGHASRYPKGALDYLDGQPWISAMRKYHDVPPRQTDVSRQLSLLADDDIRYLIVHKSLLGDEHWTRWERYLAVEPRFEDQRAAVYATRPLASQDFVLAPEIAPGIGIVRAIPSAQCLNPGQVYELDVAWGTSAPPGKDLHARLALVSGDGRERQSQVYPIVPSWPSGQWPANAVAWGYYVLPTLPALPAGTFDVTLTLVDPETGVPEGTPASVSQLRVDTSLCVHAGPPGAEHVDAVFGSVMRLLGYRLRQEEKELALTLYWRAEHRTDTDYKVFVHVYDPATQIPVAQDDAMPLRWRYPTGLWAAGEVVTDTVPIALGEVPDGDYGLAVGVYNPANMERLEVVDGTGQTQPDGRLVLPGETVRVRGGLP
jgi:hypothetical protein